MYERVIPVLHAMASKINIQSINLLDESPLVTIIFYFPFSQGFMGKGPRNPSLYLAP